MCTFGASMKLLIYTHKVTQRFSYVMRQVFGRILQVEFETTTKVEDFIKHTGPKITYAKQPLQNEFFIRANDLLFERGINDFHIEMGKWEELPCFFEAGERSNIPFDIFSASFFLLSRYEEYLPHVKDELGRFKPNDSLAFQNGFLQLPLVDLWAFKLLKVLTIRFPDLTYKHREYQFTPIVNVVQSHRYAYRSALRTFGGFASDLLTLRFSRFRERFMVVTNKKKDPFDQFFELIQLHQEYGVKGHFFFQFADYSTQDKNIAVHKNKFRFLIKSVADYEPVSLSASHAAARELKTLKLEKKRLSDLINRPIEFVRTRNNRVYIPETYRQLIEAEFTADYSMGYSQELGFRASTCTPFYFYDLLLEIQQPLRIYPFALCDEALLKIRKKTKIKEQIEVMSQATHLVNGHMIQVFSNELLGQKLRVDWMELYREMLKTYSR